MVYSKSQELSSFDVGANLSMMRSLSFLSCSAVSFSTTINISASRFSCVKADLSLVFSILSFEKDHSREHCLMLSVIKCL